jgi:NifU-like protein involved in Fe-S cluster formation/MinD-like ATPase involved in chromosome partitioning or flagellar assembly
MESIEIPVISAIAIDLAQNPRNYGPLDNFDGHARITGPCGDTMEFWLAARKEKIELISFITDGCASSLACGSMATCLAKGKGVEDAAALRQGDILEALGGLPTGVEHCALLAANTLKAACEDYLSRRRESQNQYRGVKAACDTCGDTDCSASKRKKEESEEEFEERQKLQSRLCRIRHKVVVLSGKRVGLLDVDIHGPSIPTMLGLERETIQGADEGLLPIDLDYLIIDSPPGTGDEPLSVCQLIGQLDGAVIVTTPQKVAAVDVRKSITFCRELNVPVIGVVENMSGFACPKCGEITLILRSGGGRRIAEDMHVPFLGSIPMDPKIAEACDSGHVFVHHYAQSHTAKIMLDIIIRILALEQEDTSHSEK